MSGSGGGDTTTTTAKPPEWMTPYLKGTLAFSKDVANQKYQPYGGQLVAGLDPMQKQAYDFTQSQLGLAGNQINQFAQGMNPLTKFQPDQVKAGQLSNTNLDPYMNPYTNQVVNTSLAALDRERQQQQMQNAGQAQAAGAFGGSRQGLVEAQTNEAAQRQAGQLSAGLYSQGFTQAQQAAQQDIATRMQAQLANQQAGIQGAGVRLDAGRLGGQLSQMGQQANIQSAAALEAAGQAQQQQRQAQLNSQYSQFLEKRGYPEQQQTLMLRGLGLGGAATGQTQVSTGPPGNPWMTGLGGAMGGMGIGSALGGPWGAGLGALFGGMGGLLG
jgi:hypothetical protein